MTRRVITYTLLLLFFILPVAANDKFVVVIDAGHGGKDSGAIRGTAKEKNINLGVALALGKMIENNMKDVKVVYTRKTDTFINLYRRAEIANKAKANLFISIHTNSTAAKTTTAQGADTYILGLARSEENLEVAKRENSVILLEDNYKQRYEGFNPNTPESYIIFEFMTDKYIEQSLQFASSIQKGFAKISKRKDRGVRQAGFLVLRESAMPSVLIELGFINNPVEATYLTSSTGQRSMASAIYSGLQTYIRNFNKRKGTATLSPDSSVNKQEESNITIQEDNKNDTITDKQQTNADTVVTTNTKPKYTRGERTEYRVQFLTSPKQLPKNSPLLKGVSPVQWYKEGSSYKYTYESTESETEALKFRDKIRSKFKDAFLVKFKNGKRIK